MTNDIVLLTVNGNDRPGLMAMITRALADSGADVLRGGTEGDRVNGGHGDDDLRGGSGKDLLYGEYLSNAQGEDVVAGIRTPLPISPATSRS